MHKDDSPFLTTPDRPNIRMADKFGDGRVFIAGGKPNMHLSPALANIHLPQTQHSMCTIPFTGTHSHCVV